MQCQIALVHQNQEVMECLVVAVEVVVELHLIMVVMVMVVVRMVVGVVVRHGSGVLEAKWHRFDEGVQAQTDEGEQTEPVAMDVAVFHAFAQILQPDLNQEPSYDPEPSMGIGGKGFRQEVQKAQPEQKGPAECQKQGQIGPKPLPHGLSQCRTQQCDKKQCDSFHHDRVAWRITRWETPDFQGCKS